MIQTTSFLSSCLVHSHHSLPPKLHYRIRPHKSWTLNEGNPTLGLWSCVFTNGFILIFPRFCASCERLYIHQKYQRPNIDEKLGITNENNEVHYIKLQGFVNVYSLVALTTLQWGLFIKAFTLPCTSEECLSDVWISVHTFFLCSETCTQHTCCSRVEAHAKSLGF